MNLGLRCGQILAERRSMNIIERTALRYRLERISQAEIETHTPEPKQLTTIYTRINIDNKTLELQKRIVSLEEEIKKLRPYDKAKPRYKY